MKRRMGRYRAAALLQAGMTLIELMITLSVLAVILSLAVPSFTGLLNGSRLTSQANELLTGIQMARSEAIRLNRDVVFCGAASAESGSCLGSGAWQAWIVRRASDNVVLHTGAIRGNVLVSGPAELRFRSDGMARNTSGALLNADVSVCMPVSRPEQNVRLVSISSGSRTAVTSKASATKGEC